MTRPVQLPWTEDQAANRLLATDPLALLIGMLLDQQFPMERAFLGPELLRRRLGEELSAERIASHEPGSLEQLKGPSGAPSLSRVDGQTDPGTVRDDRGRVRGRPREDMDRRPHRRGAISAPASVARVRRREGAVLRWRSRQTARSATGRLGEGCCR